MRAGMIIGSALTIGILATGGLVFALLADGPGSHSVIHSVIHRTSGVAILQEACEDRDWDNGERVCEVREVTIDAPRGALRVDGGMNGGVKVYGESRRDVRLVAEVWASARNADRAQELLEQIRLETDGGEIESVGPDTGRRESWGVSWRVFVPYETDLDVSTHNGGIAISEVDGEVRFEALNGGVQLAAMAGDVRGSTVNGGVNIELEGERRDGAGLDVTTTNGGVHLQMAEGYSAEFETGTVNGRIDTEIEMAVRGRISKTLRTQLGDGGPPIHVATTNGSVKISAN